MILNTRHIQLLAVILLVCALGVSLWPHATNMLDVCGAAMLVVLIALLSAYRNISEVEKGLLWVSFSAWYGLFIYHYAIHANICFPVRAHCIADNSALLLACISVFMVGVWIYIRRLQAITQRPAAMYNYITVIACSAAGAVLCLMGAPIWLRYFPPLSDMVRLVVMTTVVLIVVLWAVQAYRNYARDLATISKQASSE